MLSALLMFTGGSAIRSRDSFSSWQVEFIFVYGTLRKKLASSMHRLMADHCEYYADGCMQGRLYEVDGYPGAVESADPDDKVFGELYRVTHSDLLQLLDEYEECGDSFPEPREYIRKKLTVSLSDGGNVSAWVYLYNHETQGLERIESGDYLRPNQTSAS